MPVFFCQELEGVSLNILINIENIYPGNMLIIVWLNIVAYIENKINGIIIGCIGIFYDWRGLYGNSRTKRLC